MNLIKNEWQKLFLRKSSWIMQLILILMVFLMALLFFFVNKSMNTTDHPAEAPRGVTQYTDASGQSISEDKYNEMADQGSEKVKQIQRTVLSPKESVAALKMQKKAVTDTQAKEEIQRQIDYYQVYVDKGKTPKESTGGLSGADFFGSLAQEASIATILVVIVASTIVASEFSGGTIKLLLTRPYSRSQVLASKLIVCILYAIISSIVLFVSSLLFSFMLGGGSYSLPISPETGGLNAFEMALKLTGTNFVLMLTFLSIAFLFSSVVRSQALAVGVGIGALFSGNIISAILPLAIAKYDWLKWLIFNLFQLNSLTLGNEIAGGLAMWQVILTLFAYIIAILGFTFYIFKKRDVALS
ncbi:ABC transporter permease subunit [Listeria kieliensis]|uniref:ABC transporter permease n=1 Tax=Listeria kieliensis TaxID=1621700 RepID=A0A3D8TUW9_9LIST|nr:ABC transporter permease subunit [Listeria kieliensis]RDX02801.1 ABC transporter permease [Listeria kieliensis]